MAGDWTHQPVGKYLLIEWRAADHGEERINRGEVKAIGAEVNLSGVAVGKAVMFRSGSATQTSDIEDGRLQMLVHVDNIVAIATPVVT